MSQNVIELNGKRYDALTGALLGVSTQQPKAIAVHRPSPGKVVDGFIRRTPHKPAAAHHAAAAASVSVPVRVTGAPVASKPAAAPRPKIVAKPVEKILEKPKAPTAALHHAGHIHVHTPAKAAERHHPEHAKTLMRHTVQRPVYSLKPAIRPQGPAEVMNRPASAIMHKRSVAQVDPSKLERAHTTATHTAVHHFNAASGGVGPVSHHLQVVPAGHVPVIAVAPHPAAPVHHNQPTQYPDIFEAAIKHARSHEQLPHEHRLRHRRRFTNTAAAIAAFLVLGGFIGYLNLPNIQLHVASVEAGFKATMPSYRPTGYALRGGVHHDGGTVSMRFTSGDSSFQVTQQSSNWDSQTLLDNTLALSSGYHTVERNGRTIYIYGGGANAAWVTGNVRYDITGNASLSSDELANVASSM